MKNYGEGNHRILPAFWRRGLAVCLSFLAAGLMFFTQTARAAGSIDVSPQALSLYQRQTGTITVTADHAAGRVDWSASGAVSGSGSVWVENGTEEIEVIADAEGEGTVQIVLKDAATFDREVLDQVFTVAVSVGAPRALSYGAAGHDVLMLQERLLVLGYDPGSPDGIFGALTDAAVRKLQSERRLIVDGEAGPSTQASLYGDDTKAGSGSFDDEEASFGSEVLSYGSAGENVYRLQKALADLGYQVGTLDGVYGFLTEAAVIAFQAANGLYVDGVAGPVTLGILAGTYVPAGPSETGVDIRPVMSLGMSGDDIMLLQAALASFGYTVGALDGEFGQFTLGAVLSFQADQGLEQDGIAGPVTQAALGL